MNADRGTRKVSWQVVGGKESVPYGSTFTQLSILTHDVAAKNYGEFGVEDAGHIQQE